MKTSIFITLIALTTLGFDAFAKEVKPLPQIEPPRELIETNSEFAEGTITRLSAQDIEVFLPWAQNAQKVLTKALSDIESMPIRMQVDHLNKVMKSVIRRSGPKSYQMFMRFALNRSMLLVQELTKEADMRDNGILENALDIQVKSIRLALSVAESDLSYQRRVAEGNDSVKLEYAEFGLMFAKSMLQAVNSVFDASAQYRLLYKTLEIVNWDLSRDDGSLEYADLIFDIYNSLINMDENPSQDDLSNLFAIRRLNIHVEDLRKLDPTIVTATSYEKVPCGLKGSVSERIQNCSFLSIQEKNGFFLVTRTEEFKEIHKDTKTGLLWGDRLPSKMDHYHAEKACHSSLKEVAGISGVTWRLPSIDEYKEADKNGIRQAVPNMDRYIFWSSSKRQKNDDAAWLFNSDTGPFYKSRRYRSDYSVRCVAR